MTNSDTPTELEYDSFFRSEVERGVNYPIFTGAEPSLNQIPLHVAARHWSHGAIFTNGIKAIDPELPFRVVISVWSWRDRAAKLRGANTYDKAIASAKNDKRAIVFFTINKESVEDIPYVAQDCADVGVPVTFNMFSMTARYMRHLELQSPNDNTHFRFSSSSRNLSLGREERERAAELIDKALDTYPGTVFFSKSLTRVMKQSGCLHHIDPKTNLATDCAVLNTASHLSFNYDLSRDPRKDCSAPDLDCRDCRVLGAILPTMILRSAKEARRSSAAAHDFRELRRLMMQLYYWDWDSRLAS